MKKIVIVGASSGIGMEVAKLFIGRGYKVGVAPAYSATKRFQNTYIDALAQLARMQDTDMRDEYIDTAATKPSLLLSGETPNDTIVRTELMLEIKRLIIEHNKMEKQVPFREPDLLFILIGGHIAYTREDGVKVIPLACLKD